MMPMPVRVKGLSSAASVDTGTFGRTRPRRRRSTNDGADQDGQPGDMNGFDDRE
jgi:hypothetical protein